jgi:hypothetical protein
MWRAPLSVQRGRASAQAHVGIADVKPLCGGRSQNRRSQSGVDAEDSHMGALKYQRTE